MRRSQDMLGEWLIDQCRQRDLSLSEACRRAGVSTNTISEIANGTRVGVQRVIKLAKFFEVEPSYLLDMAGIVPIPATPSDDGSAPLAPTLRYKADQIMTMWRAIHVVDPAAAERLAALAVLQSEMLTAALKIDVSSMPEEETRNENAHA